MTLNAESRHRAQRLTEGMKEILDNRYEHGGIKNLHPLVRVVVALAPITIALASQHWTVAAVLVCVYLLVVLATRQWKSFWPMFWKVAFSVGGFTFVIRSLFVRGSALLFNVGPLRVTAESVESGLWYACVLSVICAAVVYAGCVVNQSEVAVGLDGIGLPPQISYVLLNSVRIIPDLVERSRSIKDSQRSRGIRIDGGTIDQLKATLPTLGPLVLSSVQGVEERAIAMEVRGFGISAGHTTLELPQRISGVQIVFTLVYMVIITGLSVMAGIL